MSDSIKDRLKENFLIDMENHVFEVMVHKDKAYGSEGERIEHGSEKFPNWNSALDYQKK